MATLGYVASSHNIADLRWQVPGSIHCLMMGRRVPVPRYDARYGTFYAQIWTRLSRERFLGHLILWVGT
ncbi:hypothetical protein QE152_g13991 [Popillia japonica]|uniref:Uncharacterized protein n=1 Tax=Popillia japonica TaxID=7064 RepID=A0AAW1LBQ1_POPJA